MAVGNPGNSTAYFSHLWQAGRVVVQEYDFDSVAIAGNGNCAAYTCGTILNVEVKPFVLWLLKGTLNIVQ